MSDHRRGPNDLKWKAVKETVKRRDVTDRLLKVISARDYLILKKKAGPQIFTLDPAHIIPVSRRPDLCYKSYNIVYLNRYSHTNLDSYKDPIFGTPITKQEVDAWWVKILQGDKEQFNYFKSKGLLEELDYE